MCDYHPWSCPLRLQRRSWTQSLRFLWPEMTGWENHARFLSLWRDPLLSACRFPQFDTCNLPCVYALFRLHSITRYVFKTLQAFAFEGQNMTFDVNTLLTCILLYNVTSGPAGWWELFAILLSQISYLFFIDTLALLWEKYTFVLSADVFIYFLHLSERTYVFWARCIGLFLLFWLLYVLAPHDLIYGMFVACCICQWSA